MAAKKRKSKVDMAAHIAARKVGNPKPRIQRHDSMDAAIAFEAGKQDYRLFKARPPKPTDENCDEPQSMRFYGWMIARANDVHKIILDIRELGLSEKKGDALLTKRAAALDRAHSPDGRDHGPIW